MCNVLLLKLFFHAPHFKSDMKPIMRATGWRGDTQMYVQRRLDRLISRQFNTAYPDLEGIYMCMCVCRITTDPTEGTSAESYKS